jgi:acyl carrier protein
MLEDRLKGVFVNALGISPNGNVASLQYGQIEEWDSVAHMGLIAAIETEFDIMIDTGDVLAMSSFNEATRILRKYITE